MGALRFKESPDGPFVNDNREMATPPWTSVRELEYAGKKLKEDKSVGEILFQTTIKRNIPMYSNDLTDNQII